MTSYNLAIFTDSGSPRGKMMMIILLLVAAAVGSLGKDTVINVERNGSDHRSCVDGTISCKTLGYALNYISQYSESDIIVNVHYSHDLTDDVMFYGVRNIIIQGYPHDADDLMTITCPDQGAGLYFNHSVNVTIRYVAWVDCGVWHPTTASANWTRCSSTNEGNCEALVLPKAMSALFMFNCVDLLLNYTSFSSSRGSGVSLYNVKGVVNITNSHFHNHSIESCNETTPSSNCSPQATGMYIEFMYCPEFTDSCSVDDSEVTIAGAQYNIMDCSFDGNYNPGAYHNVTDIPTPMELDNNRHWPFGRGGALGIVLRVYELFKFHLNIIRNLFSNNRAVYGGGVYLKIRSHYPDHNHFIFEQNTFRENEAELNGGGLAIEMDVIYDSNLTLNGSFRNHLYIGSTNFTSNKAYLGGGVFFMTYPLNVTYVEFQVAECLFKDNVYSGGGGAVALLRKEKPERLYYLIASASFHGCVFSGTRPLLAKAYSQQIMSSTVHSEGIAVSFHNLTVFADNCASALRLSDTGAMFYDKITFFNNTGFNGGGLSLLGKSWITLVYDVHVNFTMNRAYQYGGAIYYDPSPIMNMNMTSSCFVWYHQEGNINVPIQDWWVNVLFVNNSASHAGNAAYVTDPQQCIWPDQMSLFNSNRTDVFNYSGQTEEKGVVSTPSKYLQFGPMEHEKYKEPVNSSVYAEYSLMPGEGLMLKLITLDSIEQSIVSSLVCVSCYLKSDYEMYNHQNDACGKDKKYHIEDHNREVLSGSPLNDFQVYGPNVASDYNATSTEAADHQLILLFKTDDPIPVVLPLLIRFLPCSNGFKYNPKRKQCECMQNPNGDVSPVVCAANISQAIETPCIKHGYWYGKVNNDSVYHVCRSNKCRGHNGHSCGDYHEYIKLPSTDSELCTGSLNGPLCTECSNSYSLSYDGYTCLECTASHTVGLVLLILFGCLAIVVIILAFLKLNVRISTAGFYGFLYFYSVLRLLLWIPLPTGLDALIDVIVGVTSLDFQLLQYAGMCFSHFRAIHYEFLHYVYPILVIGMIFMVIKMDQSGWRRSQFFSGESSIQVLCIILLITFTSISETSLNILLPLQYQTPSDAASINRWYVYIDPGVRYMDTRKHLPYWLVAVVIELCLVLPFSLLMLFAPWVMRYVNLSKIKPILDEFQNCFQDKYRWFAGVYLLARQALFLITALAQAPERTAYAQQIFCLFLLLLVATLHPYRQKVLNIIDILLLSLLTFVSFTASSSTSRHVYYGHTNVQDTLVGVAATIPSFVMLLSIVLPGVKKLCVKVWLARRSHSKVHMNPVLADPKYDPLSTTSDDESIDRMTTPTSSSRFYTGTTTVVSRYGNGKKKEEEEEDLPPRFYDEERTHWDEKTPLLGTSLHQGGVSIQPPPNHSINTRPATN